MAQQLIIIGAGGQGRVCAEIAVRCGFSIVGFCDPALTLDREINKIPVIATDDEMLLAAWPEHSQLFVALGNNTDRVELGERARRKGIALATLIDPSAIVSETAEAGVGSVLMPNVVVNANTRIGAHCILNTACTIDHDGNIGDGVQIGPGVHAAGDVTISDQSIIGIGASLLPGVHVGSEVVVGAGAAVTKDVRDGITVTGIPAQPLRR
jgi:sugar O-acyltransferase (sialic acid O-acetyltransferase NeuD family)